jgi:hypothetical protein
MTLDLTPFLSPVFWGLAALLVAGTVAIVVGSRLGR